MSEDRKQSFPFLYEMLIMLVPCAATACFFNGVSAVRLLLVSVAACVFCDGLGTLLLKKELTLKDMSAVVTGLCVALMLPGSCPTSMAVLASVFSVVAGKLPFGDHDKAPFVPAAAGIAFLTAVYPDVTFAFTPSASSVTAASLTSMLKSGNSVNLTAPSLLNILAGNFPGPIGCTCVFFFAACLIWLALRSLPKFMTAAGFTAVCALFSLVFPRVLSGGVASLVMELGGGTLLFSAVFLMTYPNVEFDSVPRALAYGAAGGAICMLIRYFGAFEDGTCFAVLIMNALAPLFTGKRPAPAKRANGGEADE